MQKSQKLFTLIGAGVFAIGAGACAMQAPASTTTQAAPLTNDSPAKVAPVQLKTGGAETKVAIDKPVSAFTLSDAEGKATPMQWDKSKATVLIFVSTQCPVSNAYNERMAALAKTYAAKGVAIYGINANKAEDAAAIKAHAQQHNFDFAILKDQGNVIADRFDAQVTPEAYVVDSKGTLRYHGRIDDSQNASDIQSRDLQIALDAVLDDKTVPAKETRAFGCGIKRAN